MKKLALAAALALATVSAAFGTGCAAPTEGEELDQARVGLDDRGAGVRALALGEARDDVAADVKNTSRDPQRCREVSGPAWSCDGGGALTIAGRRETTVLNARFDAPVKVRVRRPGGVVVDRVLEPREEMGIVKTNHDPFSSDPGDAYTVELLGGFHDVFFISVR